MATPHNPRPVWLVLRNTATRATHRIKLDTDPRRWAGRDDHDGSARNVAIPGSSRLEPTQLLLSLPDPAPHLAHRPEYAIRIANAGVWEPSTGLNRLLTTITVRSQR